MTENQDRKKNIVFLYALLLFDIAGYSLQIPLAPYIVESLGGDSSHVGILFGVYAALQFIGALFMGSGSDKYGRKYFIALSLAGQLIGTIGQTLSKSVWVYIGTRLFTGLFDSSFTLCQAVISDLTTIDERAKFIAQIDAIYSCGFILGPLLAAFIDQVSHTASLLTSCCLFLVSLIISLLFIEETLPMAKEIVTMKKNIKQLEKNGNIKEIEREKAALINLKSMNKNKETKAKFSMSWLIFAVLVEEFCNKWCLAALDAIYAFYAENKFQMTTFLYSMLNCAEGLTNAIQQGLIYDIFINTLHMSIPAITAIAGVCDFIGFFICIYAPNLYVSMFGCIIIMIGFGFATPCCPSVVSTESSPETQGQALSVVLLGGQLSQVFVPLILGYIYPINNDLPFYISSSTGIIILGIMIALIILPGGKAIGKIPRDLYMKSYKEGKDLLIENKEKSLDVEIGINGNELDIEYLRNNDIQSGLILSNDPHFVTNDDRLPSLGLMTVPKCSSKHLLGNIEEDDFEDTMEFQPTSFDFRQDTLNSIHQPLLEEDRDTTMTTSRHHFEPIIEEDRDTV
ncbi:hypothetical protein WA158_003828 [Blastocystis sp. Blastoise]